MLSLSRGQYLANHVLTLDAGGVLVSDTRYRQPVFEGWHAHEAVHLSLILEGGNREQRKTQDIAALPSHVLFYNSYELHRNAQTKHPSRNINIEVDDSFFHKYNISPIHGRATDFNNPIASTTIINIYREAQLINSASPHHNAAVHQLMLKLLTLHAQHRGGRRTPDWVNRLRQKLHDDWNEHFSLHELAITAGVHPVTLSRTFAKYFHTSLGDYIRKLRVQKAIVLMRSNRSLTDVAHACGFYDQSHFIRVFKQVTGYRPLTFRHI